eukprot:7227147-Pyramimonas_sp.AAC.1
MRLQLRPGPSAARRRDGVSRQGGSSGRPPPDGRHAALMGPFAWGPGAAQSCQIVFQDTSGHRASQRGLA